jgi:hypothetical protein
MKKSKERTRNFVWVLALKMITLQNFAFLYFKMNRQGHLKGAGSVRYCDVHHTQQEPVYRLFISIRLRRFVQGQMDQILVKAQWYPSSYIYKTG